MRVTDGLCATNMDQTRSLLLAFLGVRARSGTRPAALRRTASPCGRLGVRVGILRYGDERQVTKERDRIQTYIILEVILIVLIVIKVVKVILVIEVLVLKRLAGEIVNRARDNLSIDGKQGRRYGRAESQRTFSLRSSPSW